MAEALLRQKNEWWNMTTWTSYLTVTAIHPYIWCPPTVYQELTSPSPDPRYQAIRVHEQVHIERQEQVGVWKWFAHYLFNPRFRFQEELVALKAEMNFLHSVGKLDQLNINHQAKIMASTTYLWMTSAQKAKQELEKIKSELLGQA